MAILLFWIRIRIYQILWITARGNLLKATVVTYVVNNNNKAALLGAWRWTQQPWLARPGKDCGGRGGGEEGKRKYLKKNTYTNSNFFKDSFSLIEVLQAFALKNYFQ